MCLHWLHQKLSFWQLPAQPEMTNSSTWRPWYFRKLHYIWWRRREQWFRAWIGAIVPFQTMDYHWNERKEQHCILLNVQTEHEMMILTFPNLFWTISIAQCKRDDTQLRLHLPVEGGGGGISHEQFFHDGNSVLSSSKFHKRLLEMCPWKAVVWWPVTELHQYDLFHRIGIQTR